MYQFSYAEIMEDGVADSRIENGRYSIARSRSWKPRDSRTGTERP